MRPTSDFFKLESSCPDKRPSAQTGYKGWYIVGTAREPSRPPPTMSNSNNYLCNSRDFHVESLTVITTNPQRQDEAFKRKHPIVSLLCPFTKARCHSSAR